MLTWQPLGIVRRLSRMSVRLHLLAAVLGACGSTGASPVPSASTPADPTGAWQLASATVDGVALQLLKDQPITAVIDASSIGGRAACNEYGGRIEIAGDGIRIGELGMTAMGCIPQAAMALEAAYVAALGRIRAIEVIDGKLALRGPDVDLRFDPLPEPPAAELVDTNWLLETVFVGDVASPPGGEPSTLQFRSDGTFSGSTGCRAFTGRWVESGAEIRAPELRMDDAECPPALVQQDSHVVSVIGDGFEPTIEGNLLTLVDPGGIGLVYRADE